MTLGEASSLLWLEGVTFGYAAAPPVFAGVTLRVARGAMVGLLGPNGAGKTTLLRVASGVIAPRAGRVWLGERDMATLGRRAVARRVAVVPQDLTMPFAYTVREMVELGRTPHLAPLGWGHLGARDRAAVTDALDRTATTPLAERHFNDLSGGERQRVLVAMALAQEPELLLLDEPTAHLDMKHQITVLDLVAELNRVAGVTVVASFHDLNLAARYFPRLVLFQGGVVADGPPSAVLAPDLLERVYGVRVRVGVLPGGEYLSVALPEAALAAALAAGAARAHVVAGGGTGDLVMRALVEAGIAFSAGPLNIGDSDHGLATRLARSVIPVPPYAPIPPEALVATRAAMAAAGSVILCPAPIGVGNVGAIQAAVAARAAGGIVWLFEPAFPAGGDTTPEAVARHVASRDYADGAGAAAYGTLARLGARLATSLPELLSGVLAEVGA